MKTNFKKLLFIGLSIVVIPVYTFAQDTHFSQFNNSPLFLNPASAGVFNGDFRVIANYKNQWKEVSDPFKTYAITVDGGLLKKKWSHGYIGLGLSILNDKAGASKMSLTQENISLSSVISLNDNSSLSVGLQAGVAQRSTNYSGLQWANQYNGQNFDSGLSPNESFSTNNFVFQDYSAGLLWNFRKGETYSTSNDATKANFGIAMFHINKPEQSFFNGSDKLYSKYVIHGMFYKGLKNTNASVIPSGAVYLQGKSKEILVGLLVKYNLKDPSKYTGNIKAAALYLGGNYRVGDAIAICAQLEIDKYFIGLSYDVNVSGLTSVSKGLGGLELSLRFINSKIKSRHSNSRYL
ncbi:MAG: PorP/SprF family type IX secretion system membrane protein [Bacteroidetes bacterium]|nr:PorP/SprF family type IX secretion system membrane protein [Bacteroidota bacterium]